MSHRSRKKIQATLVDGDAASCERRATKMMIIILYSQRQIKQLTISGAAAAAAICAASEYPRALIAQPPWPLSGEAVTLVVVAISPCCIVSVFSIYSN